MSAPYKDAIMREENALNEEPVEVREELIRFLYINKCRDQVSEVANGSNINLDKLPENILKQFYHLVYKKLGIPTEDFNY